MLLMNWFQLKGALQNLQNTLGDLGDLLVFIKTPQGILKGDAGIESCVDGWVRFSIPALKGEE